MNALTPNQIKLIVSNVAKACKDISKLNSTGYKFLNLASGFIAHYDLNGFKAYYEDHDLARDIRMNAKHNMWLNFKPGDCNYEYYSSKADAYRSICQMI